MSQPIENYTPLEELSKIHWRTKTIWIFVTGFFFSWILFILLAPVARANELHSISNPIYSFFSYACHQNPSRSFHVFENPFAVCARCFGFYSGFFLSFILFPLIWNLHEVIVFRRVWIFAAMIPITIDWALGYFGIWENTHLSRAITGAILGAACGVFIVPALIEITRIVSEKLDTRGKRNSV